MKLHLSSFSFFACAVAVISHFACANEVKVSDFGFDPTDSTRFVQAAIDSGATRVILDKQNSPWYVTPILARSNLEFVVEPAAELVAKRGEFKRIRDYLFTLDGVSNVVIRGGSGATFRMWKCDYQKPPYEKSEWRYALRIVNSQNVLVENMRFIESGGDGIVIGGNSKGVTIRNCVCDRNHRQGISLCSGEDVLIENCVLSNTEGTAPQAGIDIEPDHPRHFVVNCTLRNVLSYGNAGAGFDICLNYLDDTSRPVSLRLENCRSIGNNRGCLISGGGLKDGERFARGSVVVENCLFEDPLGEAINIGVKPAEAYSVTFKNCTITNRVCEKEDVLMGTSGTLRIMTLDGIHLENLAITHTGKKDWFKMCHRLNTTWPKDISGSVTVGDNVIALDEAWLKENLSVLNMPQMESGKTPHLENVRVVDTVPGENVALPNVTLVGESSVVFYMAKPGEALLRGRQIIKVKNRPPAKGKYLLTRLMPRTRGKPMRIAPFGVDSTTRKITLAEAGFYRLTFPRGGSRIKLESANVPLAIDLSQCSQIVGQENEDPIELWLSTQEGANIISVCNDYYRFKTVLSTLGTNGVEGVIENQLKDADVFLGHLECAKGLAKIRFSKDTRPHYDWVLFDIRGNSPYAFFTPNRYWENGNL